MDSNVRPGKYTTFQDSLVLGQETRQKAKHAQNLVSSTV